MDDLVQWLRAQLDEGAEEAHAAAEELGADWFYDDGMVLARREQDLVATGSQDFLEAERGRFIAAHDPARVLREIDAKRAIVDDLAEFIRWGARKGLDYQDGVDACERTLKRLALPYADRPGYQESWRP